MTQLSTTDQTPQTPLQRLETGRLMREAQTLRALFALYDAQHGGSPAALSERSQELLDYALMRLARCPFGQNKPVCARCPVHCYKPQQRQAVQQVMRVAGPRLALRHPLLALEHLWYSWTVPAPQKARNRAQPHNSGSKE